MHLFKLDTYIYNMYKKKWRLEEEDTLIPTYHLPKLWKKQFVVQNEETSLNELVLFKYPSHYQHNKIFQYDSGFKFYFGMFGTFFLYKSLSGLIRLKSFKRFLFYGMLSTISFFEGYVISSRVKDIKSIVLKNGKMVAIKTFQDGELEFQMDVKDTRITNKKKEDEMLPSLMVFIDVNMARDRNFMFFFCEPTPGTVYNPELFYTILYDKRYVTYD
jgi:hypothetical protein